MDRFYSQPDSVCNGLLDFIVRRWEIDPLFGMVEDQLFELVELGHYLQKYLRKTYPCQRVQVNAVLVEVAEESVHRDISHVYNVGPHRTRYSVPQDISLAVDIVAAKCQKAVVAASLAGESRSEVGCGGGTDSSCASVVAVGGRGVAVEVDLVDAVSVVEAVVVDEKE
ncbi:hypothetical protein Tco_0444644 [Tanacetum coccineum]